MPQCITEPRTPELRMAFILRLVLITTTLLPVMAWAQDSAQDQNQAQDQNHAQGQQKTSLHPYFDRRHTLSLGVTRQTADSELRASVPRLPEITVDLSDLGVDDTDESWLAEYRWRFSSRWSLVLAAYRFGSEGSRDTQRDFNFDGVEFEAGVALDTYIDIDTYIVDLLYAVHRSDKTEVLVGGGLHAFDLAIGIDTRAFAGDRERSDARADEEVLAPLPNLRAQAFHAFDSRWGVGLTAGWLSASYEDYSGGFGFIHLRGSYRFSKRFGVQLGYQFTHIDLTIERSNNRELELNVDMQGPTLLLAYNF